MTIEQISQDTQPPDLLLAVIEYVDNYQQGGIVKSPEQVAAAIMLQRVLIEGDV